MYADDTHVTITSNNLEDLLENAQRELLNISEWMRINKRTANPKKTEYMLIGHPRKVNKLGVSEPLMLNNAEIKRTKKTKSLGVIVDEGLNWEQHFKVVKGKVRGGLSSLKKLKNPCATKTTRQCISSPYRKSFAVCKCYLGQYS